MQHADRSRATAVTMFLLVASLWVGAQTKLRPMPYVTVDHPNFLPVSQATFLHAHDRVIGVEGGGVAKAYPAAILAQHGVVQDRTPSGPIAVTW